ncbi:MAG: hypothetical protein A3K19_06355 [Lentisphaerae bacterium RIFOXYB12_FULL_65_16]|nr:MAG: hypothetical protein A3K19_06355 [Lentisphaerae bacterium RIFOXYB12_FULL_65_16]
MSRFRYASTANWYKGNTHTHTKASDGGKTYLETARLYAGARYDFLVRTDHWVTSDVAADPEPSPLLWIDGIELDGADGSGAGFHVVCLGKCRDMERKMGLVLGMERAREQDALLVLAHPFWCGNSFSDALRHRFDGVETYNHVCRWLNGKSDGLPYWNAMLSTFPGTLGIAADDCHLRPEHPGWNGGWVMVNAPELSPAAILASIRRGEFYASCGPSFLTLECDGQNLHVRTSPVQFVRVVGPGAHGVRVGSFDGSTMTEATLKVPAEWPYAYLEIEDAQGRCAWTNTLFVAEE